jgi:peptide/nickel transport system permease protein
VGEVVGRKELAQALTRGRFEDFFKSIRFNKSMLVGGIITLVLVTVAIFAPFITPNDPEEQDLVNALMPVIFMEGGNSNHILGTDALGRDLLSRIIIGLRTSLFIGFSSVLIGVSLGTLIGLLAGYFGGWVDTLLMRLVDMQLAFPVLILAVIILTVARPSIPTLLVVFVLALWPVYARVVRVWTIVEKQAEYVVAGRMIGASHSRVIFNYLCRILLPLVAIIGTVDIATIIILEAILGFLGLGVQPPTPSWGNIIADGRVYITTAWWLSFLPGLAIFVTVFSLNLFADGLQEAMKLERIRK